MKDVKYVNVEVKLDVISNFMSISYSFSYVEEKCSACFCFQDEEDTTVGPHSLRSEKCLCVNIVHGGVKQIHIYSGWMQ